jgi:hypothetical protein
VRSNRAFFSGTRYWPTTEWLSNSQFCGSMQFWYGSGSADPYLWLMDPDPDPAIFVSDLQLFAHYFLKVHLHHFSKTKRNKEVTKQ